MIVHVHTCMHTYVPVRVYKLSNNVCVTIQYAADDDLFKPTAVAAAQPESRDDKPEEEEKDNGEKREGYGGIYI